MARIEILDYRPEWAEAFAQIGEALRRGLAEKAVRISHIGSTSVPGLSAKDVIDVQVSVQSIEIDEPTRRQFEAAGFPSLDNELAQERQDITRVYEG